MAYRADTLIEKALKNSANAIAEARIKEADQEKQWTSGLTKKEKRRWITAAYFPELIGKLEELAADMREYNKQHGKQWL